MTNQIGGRSKGVVIIAPDRKTYRDYGLPSAKELPESAFAQTPKLFPKAESGALSQVQIVRVVLGEENNSCYIRTPLEPVVISKERLKHISEKRAAFRERYTSFIIPTLTNPNEIWLTRYKDGSFRRRFIKLFKGEKNMLVIARENIDSSLFWNAIPANSRYIDNQRTGTLLYKNN